MIREVIFWSFVIGSPIFLSTAMLYGDYKAGEWKPPWQKKKKDVNSGAKFG